MEKRAILAAALMAAVFIVFQMFFSPEPPPPQKPPAETAAQPTPAPTSTPSAPPPAPTQPAPVRSTQTPRPPQTLATVEAPLYRDVISSEGGKLQELQLRYRGGKPMVIVGDLGPAGLQLASDPKGPGEVVAMRFDKDTLVLTDKPGDLVMTGEADGLKIRQTFRFHPDGYAIEVNVRVENPGAVARTVGLSLPWLTRQVWRGTAEKFQGQHPTEIVWSSHGSPNRFDDLTDNHPVDGDWIALDSVWYLGALIPKSPDFKIDAWTDGKVPDTKPGDTTPAGRATIAVKAAPTIAPGQTWEGSIVLYAGPKEYERLRTLGLEETS
jgi:YidC/Oxa1 family membrane protein insertase